MEPIPPLRVSRPRPNSKIPRRPPVPQLSVGIVAGVLIGIAALGVIWWIGKSSVEPPRATAIELALKSKQRLSQSRLPSPVKAAALPAKNTATIVEPAEVVAVAAEAVGVNDFFEDVVLEAKKFPGGAADDPSKPFSHGAFDVSATNNSQAAIAEIEFEFRVLRPGRTIPLTVATFTWKVSGGLEPMEQKTATFIYEGRPVNYIDPVEVELQARATTLVGPNAKILATRRALN